MTLFRNVAAGCLAGCVFAFAAVNAEAAPERHAGETGTTEVHTSSTVYEKGVWNHVDLARSIKEKKGSADSDNTWQMHKDWIKEKKEDVKQTYDSTLPMKMWDVKAKDTGGTLLFSDSPEYVKTGGILYSDTVKGDARVLYYHLNDSPTQKKVAVILENPGKEIATVQVTRGGSSEPSSDYLKVGKETQIEYFNDKINQTISVLPGCSRLLQMEMDSKILYPGQLVYGVYDFNANKDVKVSVLMYPVTESPFEYIKKAEVLPKDEHRLRGTFAGMDRVIRSERKYNPKRDGIVYFPIGDNVKDTYRKGIDATDGSTVVNYGNYGVLYHIEIPTEGPIDTQYYLSPLGGVYAGAMSVEVPNSKKSGLLLTPNDKIFFGDHTPGNMPDSAITRETELANLGSYDSGRQVSFQYSPPGASNLPVNIILMPSSSL